MILTLGLALSLLSRVSPILALSSDSQTVHIAPSEDGRLGAWLVAGPFDPAKDDVLGSAPTGVDESVAPERGKDAGRGVRWQLAASARGALDLAAALHTKRPHKIGYAGGTIHLPRAAKLLFLVGADDGARLTVDGNVVLSRDEARPVRDDDDVVALALPAGDHTIALKVHQRDGAWGFHLRVVDQETLAPPPGAYLTLPGTSAADARLLAGKMATLLFDRGLGSDGFYHPTVSIRFFEGSPLGVPLSAHVQKFGGPVEEWTLAPRAAGDPGDGGVHDFGGALPPVSTNGTVERYTVTLSGQQATFVIEPRQHSSLAIQKATVLLETLPEKSASRLQPATISSLTHLRDRLLRLVNEGDGDLSALEAESAELEEIAQAIIAGKDPYGARRGAMRRAYVSPVDQKLSEFGLYVPEGFDRTRKYPLVVALHGWNGRAMSMMRWVFGYDDPEKDASWEDRHPVLPLPHIDAFVVTPDAHFNSMYRDMAEDDVMRVIDWAMATYPIDPSRVTITGPSMGGIGTAQIAFHHPDRFAAAAPLCGYHDYFVRRDIKGRPLRPWETAMSEERSNVQLARNGKDIPLYVVHGTLDLPIENSGHLIDAYEHLGYSVRHEHPPLGHNVWQTTYAGLSGLRWLTKQARDVHPKEVRFRTFLPRYGDDAWVHIREIEKPGAFGDVTAKVVSDHELEVTTNQVNALVLDRDKSLVRPGPVTVVIDGTSIEFPDGSSCSLSRDVHGWKSGQNPSGVTRKHGSVAGPLRDIFHEPALFVYGANDPALARANEEVARAWARVRPGVRVHYPVMSDAEFLARGESLANDKALFLFGNARSNRVLAKLDRGLPLHIEGDQVVLGEHRYTGTELGAAFISPNPERPERYVAVVEAGTAEGMWRSLSLPDLLPDFVVYDVEVARARGQILLGLGRLRAAGFFENDWSIPKSTDDPEVPTSWPGPQNEYEATPYLP